MPISTWIGLILCNLVWSMNPTFAKRLVQEVGPQQTAWLKYTVALTAYVILMQALRFTRHRAGGTKSLAFALLFMPITLPWKDLVAAMLIGLATCFISPMMQMSGLVTSSASTSAILVTFEPLFAVFFGWVFLGERLKNLHYLSFLLAIIGFLYLSNVLSFKVLQTDIRYGDWALLVAVAGEALYSALGRGLSKRYPSQAVFGTAMLSGVVALSVAVLPWKGLPHFGNLSPMGWFGVMWLGIIGTAIPYLYWLFALNRSLSLGSVVLSLFVQPIFGTVAGVVFLGETLGTGQLLGGAMIVAAVGIQMLSERKVQIDT